MNVVGEYKFVSRRRFLRRRVWRWLYYNGSRSDVLFPTRLEDCLSFAGEMRCNLSILRGFRFGVRRFDSREIE